MEMLVIAVVAVAAFAAVLIPLFRRGPKGAEESEFEPVATPTAGAPLSGTSPGTGPAVSSRGSATVSSAGMAGATAVPGIAEGSGTSGGAEDPLELEVQRYRVAVRSGTVCRKCGQANPAASVYCFDCGERLPLGDAKEFE